MKKIEFIAYLPPIQSAIKRSGNGDGMRVQLDIPESEMGQGAYLLLATGKPLKVTIELKE